MSIFENRYRRIFKDNFDEPYIKGTLIRKSIRVNTIKTDNDKLIKRLKDRVVLEKINFLDNGFFADSDFSLASTPEYLMGLFYIQEAASQIPAQVLNPKASDVVLDMCAAPGSKTTQLAMLMKNKGTLIAIDESKQRIGALKNNLERMGVTNSIVYKKDARFVDDLGIRFDKILLDAPCSGNYMIDGAWFEKRDYAGIRENARRQKELLASAVHVLKEDGVIVYSTCSLEPEENENIVDWAQDTLGLRVIDVKFDEKFKRIVKKFKGKDFKNVDGCIRVWPDQGMSGFFVAKLKMR